MFAQQTLLFISLSSEQQLPNGAFVLRTFSNSFHTNSVCFPQWQLVPNLKKVWPLSLSGQAQLPAAIYPPFSSWNGIRCLSPLILKGDIFGCVGKGVRSPQRTWSFLKVSPYDTGVQCPAFIPPPPRSLLLFKSRVLIIAHFTSLPPIPSHSALFFIAVRGGWYQNEIHHSTVLPPCHCFSLPMASHRAQDNRSVVCYSDLLAH